MPRILLLIILIGILYIVVKRFLVSNASTTKKEDAPVEEIVACSQCGLHIPESESRLIDGLIVCNNPECNRH